MTCYHPEVLRRLESPVGRPQRDQKVPCGSCIGCRFDRSKEWAARCVHELKSHDESCFVTLTYNNENLPFNGSLDPNDLTLFNKLVRRHCGPFRFFACGEYGERYGRPHYHSIIFGLKPPKQDLFDPQYSGINIVYRSKTLEKLWNKGRVIVGDVSYDSCAYVARYIVKKQFGKSADYSELDTTTGELIERLPEFTRMSRRPGIGHKFIAKYFNGIYCTDNIHILEKGLKLKPPRYYDNYLKKVDKKRYNELKRKRRAKAKEFEEKNKPEKLLVREEILVRKTRRLKRVYEQGVV